MKKMFQLGFAVFSVALLWIVAHHLSAGMGVPSILETLHAVVKTYPILFMHLGVSALRLFIGLFIAFVIGSIVGIVMARSPQLDAILSPIVYLLTPLPKVAFLPIAMVIFGVSETSRIGILVFVVVFQFVVASRDALKSMPQQYVQSMRSLKLKKVSQYKHVLIPYSAPFYFTAIRQGFGMSIAVLFFVETFVNQQGMGYYIMNRWGMVNYPDMYSGILFLSVFGYVVYYIIDMCQKKACPWLYLNEGKSQSK